MRVIILKNVPGLGKATDVKEVADGYAINYLIPNKLARPANEKNINLVKQLKIKKITDAEKDLIETEKLADRLSKMVLEIKSQINEQGRLYASISKSVIAEKLKEKGLIVKKDRINLAEPIKELGDYTVSIALDHGLEAEVSLVVTEQ